MAKKQLAESAVLLMEASATKGVANRKKIQIITPGWGTTGYYSPEVLEAAAEDKVIPAGTHMYLNHATESEKLDRKGVRDLRELAAVTVEDAVWDGNRLVAEADLLGSNGELVESLAPYIGVSVSGYCTGTHIGEAEGDTGEIVEGIATVGSVDFVTKAGRDGKIMLESARPSLVNALAVGKGISEATANDIRDALSVVLRDQYGGDKTYLWVRDFDDSTVWFEVEDPNDAGIFAQAYTEADGAVSLTGERTEVRVVTQFVPVNPAGPTPTKESKEDTMATTQIEEAEKQRLIDEAGRVPTLESERDAEKARADKAEAALAEQAAKERTSKASKIIAEQADKAEVAFTPGEVIDFVANLPMKEGAFDEEAFTQTISEAAAKKLEEAGAGKVVGMGGKPISEGGNSVTWGDIDPHLGIEKGA